MCRTDVRTTAGEGVSRRQGVGSYALACLILLLGAALRFYDLGVESYWYDEMITVRLARDGLSAVLNSFARAARPPVHPLLTTLWMRAAGSTEFSTRFVSAFAGVLSVAAIYAVGYRLFSRKVGLVSAFLMVLSEFQIWYSQESRYYAVLVLLTLVSFYLLARTVERSCTSNWVFLVAVNTLLIFTHTYAVFTIPAQALYVLVTQWHRHRNTVVILALSQAIVLALGSPSLYVIARDSLTGGFGPMSWIRRPDLMFLGETVLIYVGSNYPSSGTVLAALGFLFAVTLVAWTRRTKERSSLRSYLARIPEYIGKHRSGLLLVGLWLVCLWVLPWLLSRLVEPIYVVRYTIGAAPALYLLLAAGIEATERILPITAVLGSFIILVAPGLVAYYQDDIKEDWRGAAGYVTERVQPQDAVVVPPGVFGRDAFEWYYDAAIVECHVDPQLRHGEDVVGAAERCGGDATRLWLVLREYPLRKRRLEDADWQSAGLRLLEQVDFEGVGVYLFAPTGNEGALGGRETATTGPVLDCWMRCCFSACWAV